MEENINVIQYCRVSTDEQADNCSLDIQEQRLRAHCLAHNYTIENVKKEDYSAKHFDLKRPEMRSIYEWCKKNKGKVNKILFPVFRTILSLKNYDIVNQINNYQKRVVLGHLAPFFV